MANLSDEELLKLIIEVDDAELASGGAPKARSLTVTLKSLDRLGYKDVVVVGPGAPPIVKKIFALHHSLYRKKDLAVGGVHGGVFMFRDVFARISIPLGYGKFTLDPFTLTDLSPMQLKWLSKRPADMRIFLDQFTDIFDFAGGITGFGNFKSPPEESIEIMRLAAFQLQAAAATLSVAFDFRGAVQSSIIGVELALKGGLAAIGVNEGDRRGYGHDLISVANSYAEAMPNFDLNRVLKAIKFLPVFVKNRYSSSQPGRLETGHIAMRAQYIAGEVMRQITGYTIRSASAPIYERIYPG